MNPSPRGWDFYFTALSVMPLPPAGRSAVPVRRAPLQGARPSQLVDFNKPTLINDVVQAKIDKRPDKNYPNGNMGTAHAEIGVIQQAYEKGMTNGKDMLMSVSGQDICSFCLTDIKLMAEKSGLKSLTLFEESTGRTLYWETGTKGFRIKGANNE